MIAKCLRKIIRQLILILLVLYVKKRKIYSGYISKNDGDFDFFNCLHSLRTKKTNKTESDKILSIIYADHKSFIEKSRWI